MLEGIFLATLKRPEIQETGLDSPRSIEARQEPPVSVHDPRIDGAETLEEEGRNHFWAAMRSKNPSEFGKQLRKSGESYREAESRYIGLETNQNPRILRCRAMTAYVAYWRATDPAPKKQLLRRSWELAKRSLKGFESASEPFQYARTYNQTSDAVGILLFYESTFETRVQRLREAIEHGRAVIGTLSGLPERTELVRAYARTALFLDLAITQGWANENQQEDTQEAISYWNRAIELDRTVAVEEISFPIPSFCETVNLDESTSLCREALARPQLLDDNLRAGWLLDQLARCTFYKARSTQDPVLRANLVRESIGYSEDAAERLERIHFTCPNDGVTWIHSPYAEYFQELAWLETSPEKKRLLMEKSVHGSRELVSRATRSGYPQIVSYGHHVAAKAYVGLARIEPSPPLRKRLLHTALQHRERSVKIIEQVQPNQLWNRGIVLRYLAEILSDLAELEEDQRVKRRLLNRAARRKAEALELCVAFGVAKDRGGLPSYRMDIGRTYYEYGDLLTRLFKTDKNNDTLRKASKAYTDGFQWYQNPTVQSRIAECYWKVAQTYDELQANKTASEYFALASSAYVAAAQEMPQMSEIYSEYSRYLGAWSKIELARLCHQNLEYEEATRYFEDAAALHESTGKWKFLTPYYSAWAKIEQAESFSKRGLTAEARDSFAGAADLFRASKLSVRNRLATLQEPEEKMLARSLAVAPRDTYCIARMIIEEAKIAESNGEHRTGSEKFGLASDKLAEVSGTFIHDGERREIEFISLLARAWQQVSKSFDSRDDRHAERAFRLFEAAREKASDENGKLLASAHGHFYQAVLSTKRFIDTLDAAHYNTAIDELAIATTHYTSSGFKAASAHARGYRLLLDANVQIGRADREANQEIRSTLYKAAGTLLNEAAEAFEQAGQPATRKQVLDLLEKVDTERELASHLASILNASSNLSTTFTFPSIWRGEERAVGTERFDRSGLEIRYSSHLDQGPVGKSVQVMIELMNIGRRPIRLFKLADAIPEETQLLEAPPVCRAEGRSLSLNLLKIDPLKTETLKFVLLLKTQGPITIRPEILFLDDKGDISKCNLQPRILVGSPILTHLAESYSEDRDVKNLAPSHCGWRTLMSIVEALKIPRSHLYGPRRYNRAYGRQLDDLVKAGLVESRIFPGERGRGGEITKIRISYENQPGKRYDNELALVH